MSAFAGCGHWATLPFGSDVKIPFVINILITAVRNGDLNDRLAQAKKPATAATSRKAA
jgi:hypothetical protein